MATDTLLITAAEACELQDASINGQETASQSTANSILSYINTQVKTATRINADYCDIKWANIKNNQSTEVILTWIGLKPENTLEEHYFGIQTKTVDGDYVNQWIASVGSHLTAEEVGYRWCFIYNRDTEQPFGMRVCWHKADYYESPGDDPIVKAQQEYQYIILPTTKLVLPPAEEVEIIHVEQQEKEQNKALMKQMFSTINATIQKRAKDGFDHAFIPWSSLGNSREMQSLFFQEAENYLTIIEKSETEGEKLTGVNLTDIFSYGEFTSGYYATTTTSGVKFKSFSANDYDLGFFDDNTYGNDDYLTPEANKTFTLYDLITNSNYLGYGLSFYAALDTVNVSEGYAPYCDGICIAWAGEDTSLAQSITTLSSTMNYNKLLADYTASTQIEYTTLDAPTFESYEESCRKNNSAYLQAVVNAITSKMATAFTKNERAIYVLWKDISSNLPDQAYEAWHNSNAMYDGVFPAMHNGASPLWEGYVGSLANAFGVISHGAQYHISDDYEYMWAYCWYNKDGKEGFSYSKPTTNIQDLSDDSTRKPAGIVIALYGKVEDGSGYTAQQQTAHAILKAQSEVFAIVDPANKNNK